ncbi:expressed unknown protein [Seminavis robusta]|uniref:Uncharacterized protein n=1 Tax=Seminavis robusta TaxID=568900 RepID=A0A9N8EYS1_9STRA|nr:expressed unknown protein [Seminavis robusta]|eukprot:Sro2135_g315970.1 n/a (374) ;mRNA; r:5048-6293
MKTAGAKGKGDGFVEKHNKAAADIRKKRQDESAASVKSSSDEEEEEEVEAVSTPAKKDCCRQAAAKKPTGKPPLPPRKRTKKGDAVKAPELVPVKKETLNAANLKWTEEEDSILAGPSAKPQQTLSKVPKKKEMCFGEFVFELQCNPTGRRSPIDCEEPEIMPEPLSRHMLPCMNHFIGCWRFVKKPLKSGWSEEDYINAAIAEYKDKLNKDFKFAGVLDTLKALPRFDPISVTKRQLILRIVLLILDPIRLLLLLIPMKSPLSWELISLVLLETNRRSSVEEYIGYQSYRGPKIAAMDRMTISNREQNAIQAKKRAVSQAYSFAKTLKDFGRMDEANQKLDEAMILEATPLEHFLMNCAPTTVTATGTANIL